MDAAVTARGLSHIASGLVDMPIWLSGLLIVGGLPLLIIGSLALVRRRFPVLLERRHNDVAGFLLAVIGVIYAVTSGFILLNLQDNFHEGKQAANSEAFTLMGIARTSRVMGEEHRRRITGLVLDYEWAVIRAWPPGQGSAEAPAALDRLLAEIAALRPVGEAQKAFVSESTRELMQVSVSHEDLDIETHEGHLQSEAWAIMIISSAATLGFCLIFGLENARLHYLMVAGVTIVVAGNLFLMVELNYPFRGDLSVRPVAYFHVIAELGR